MSAAGRLILASASPRRRELLHEAGFDFEVHPADVDEDDYPPTTLPADVALHLARVKSRAVSARFPDDFVLGADTVVAFGDQVLGKPADEKHARELLDLLSSTTHIVITGVCLCRANDKYERSTRVMSCVRMRMLTSREIQAYVAGGEWRGKAGGYGIQDNDPFVTRMAGCHTNIVGLPMTATKKLLADAGIVPKQP